MSLTADQNPDDEDHGHDPVVTEDEEDHEEDDAPDDRGEAEELQVQGGVEHDPGLLREEGVEERDPMDEREREITH